MGVREAGAYLHKLLADPGRPRVAWTRHGSTANGEVAYAAIARVIEEHLWDSGERQESTGLARQLKDKVRRAVTGQTLTPRTLDWFVDAFSMPEDEARRLRALLDGTTGVQVLYGTARERRVVVPRRTRTLSLHEHHYVGADRMPFAHVTTQVLEATDDGVGSYLYMFDTAALAVDVLQGGTVSGPVFEVADGLYGVDIRLTRPLAEGQTTTLTYRTAFYYDEAPPGEFRRAAFFPLDSVDIRVEFDPRALPRSVAYSEWQALDGAALFAQGHTLEEDRSVHVFLRSIENVIVGFTWTWDTDSATPSAPTSSAWPGA